jgi:hypothetical protein
MATATKRLRFEVMRRDGFACHYCGRTPPDVKLTVDAVVPEALGGSHKDPANLVTACGDCNGGKSSTSPDAPLVAAVADDAAKWAGAMQAVAEDMRTEAAAGVQACEVFDGTWSQHLGDCWRPADWARSVQVFTKYGLPLEVLQECVAIAAGSRAPQGAKWRYMCKVAWGRLGEIRERTAVACGINPAPTVDSVDGSEGLARGRIAFARDLLGKLNDEERRHYLDRADYSDYTGEPLSEEEITCDAASDALDDARFDADYLCRELEATLNELPDGIGVRALKAPGRTVSNLSSPLTKRTFHLIDALYRLRDYLDLPAARELLDDVSGEEREQWLAYARALYERAEGLDDAQWLVRAAKCARMIMSGRYWVGMCEGPGQHIPLCPTQGAYRAKINEWSCCGTDAAEDHDGHDFCATHTEQLVDGTLVVAGQKLTTADFGAVPDRVWP